MKKKGEISLQIIIIAVLLLIILIVLTVIFLNRTGIFTSGVSSCEQKGGACLTGTTNDCTAVSDQNVKQKCTTGVCVKVPGTNCDKDKTSTQICCMPLAG